jgi:hypothetical protein
VKATPADFSRLDELVEDPPEPLGEPGVHLARQSRQASV